MPSSISCADESASPQTAGVVETAARGPPLEVAKKVASMAQCPGVPQNKKSDPTRSSASKTQKAQSQMAVCLPRTTHKNPSSQATHGMRQHLSSSTPTALGNFPESGNLSICCLSSNWPSSKANGSLKHVSLDAPRHGRSPHRWHTTWLLTQPREVTFLS